MPEAMGNISWATYALVIAAVILAVVLVTFPDLTRNIMSFLSGLVDTAGTKISSSIPAVSSAPGK